MEKELLMHFKNYEKTLNALIQYPGSCLLIEVLIFLVQPNSRGEKLKKNLQASFVSVIQDTLPAFKQLKMVMPSLKFS